MRSRHFWFGLLLGAVLLGAFLWRLDWAAVHALVRTAPPWLLVAGMVHGILVYVARGGRWLILLRRLGPVDFGSAFRANTIGFGVNVLFPGRVGELVRAFLISREHGLPFGRVMATVLVERLADLFIFIPVYLLYVFFFPSLFPGPLLGEQRTILRYILRGTLILMGVLGFLTFGAAIWARKFNHELRADNTLTRGLRRLQVFIRQVGHGALSLRGGRVLAGYYGVTWLFWLFVMGGLWLQIRPFSPAVPWAAPPWVNLMLILGVSIPTPGAVGGYHWSFRLALTAFFGFDGNAASTAALWAHLCAVLPPLALTLYYLGRMHLSMKSLLVSAESAPQPPFEEQNDEMPPVLPGRHPGV